MPANRRGAAPERIYLGLEVCTAGDSFCTKALKVRCGTFRKVITMRRAFCVVALVSKLAVLATILLPASLAQEQRPPAVPLIVHNPYFSIWSMADRLTDDTTRHWTGAPQPIAGLVRIDGHPYRYMGSDPSSVPAMRQISLRVEATRTTYQFESAGVRLQLEFFTPAFPQNMDVLSRPVTYLTWTASSADGAGHTVDLLLDVDPRIAVDTDNQKVTWGRSQVQGLTVLNVGSRDQQPLNRSGDNLRIDWGYFHLAVPDSEAASTVESGNAIGRFLESDTLPASDDMDMPQTPRDGAAHLAAEFRMNCAPGKPEQRHLLVAYTQDFEIEYLERMLRPTGTGTARLSGRCCAKLRRITRS